MPAEAPEQAEARGANEMEKAATWQAYGGDVATSEPVSAKTVLDSPDTYVDQAVLVEGEVADVCQKAGCWMVVTDGTQRTMRVRMKDHDFSVPKDCSGKTARITGTVVAKEIDPKDVAHFEGESAKPEVMPEKGKTGTTYELIASAVQIQG